MAAADKPVTYTVDLTEAERFAVSHAFEGRIAVIQRRLNTETNPDIKAVLEKEKSFVIGLSRRFVL